MRKARNNNNFIDKTFTIIADVILRVFPASQQEKKAFYQESKTYKMLYIDSQKNINDYSISSEQSLGICYVKKGYMNLNFDKNKISEYIIISKNLE